MLDLKQIRQNPEGLKKAIQLKGGPFKIEDVDELLKRDRELSALKTQIQELQAKRNTHSKKIPRASVSERPALVEEGRHIGQLIGQLRPKLDQAQIALDQLLYLVPNYPAPNAPVGQSEEDNVEIKRAGEIPRFSFQMRDHVELLTLNHWAEFEKIGEICGSRSYSLKNEMVLLEHSIYRLAMDKLLDKGFNLISMPSFTRQAALLGTGHFPEGEDQVYTLPQDHLYLSGTSEVQLNSLHAGEILKASELPLLYAGYSPCFRREAGSYGRDVRGLIRVHQFTKLEQYIICKNDPDESSKWQQTLLSIAEEIVCLLELPYRIVECCTGDMGTGKVRMFDIECWVPSEEKYRETHSCSALHDWQARRTQMRYRDGDGKIHFCHTLNNTAVATPRILVALLENHQREDGHIQLPRALRPYFGKDVLGQTNI